MSNNNMQQTTFWKFIQNHKVEIPIIQRDYAQGRIGNEKLREKFLCDLKNALDGEFTNKETILKLDFVYGSVENERLNPLDGQQRLTTLWLIHWYIAFKAGLLSDNKEFFKNFSYETRTSSREFCNSLCEFNSQTDELIVKQIQKQTWFFSVWKQDPTIQAMLNMLGGTTIKDSKNNEIPDGIEEVFNSSDAKIYTEFWKKLTGDNCPIIFYYLDLDGLSLSDDLYIKMNARGKPLSSFENFKADLVGFIKEKEGEKGKNTNNKIAQKLDTTWTDIFWKNKSKEHKIDEIYFTLLKRYFLNSLITAKRNKNIENAPQKSDYWITSDKIEQSESFKSIWNLQSVYTSFDVFKPKEGDNEIFDDEIFSRLSNTLDNFHVALKDKSKEDINKLFYPAWDSNTNFCFIPEYIENPNAKEENNEPNYIPTTLTQPQRVVFYAICSFFEKNQYNDKSFKQWMRVVWNIIENANINSVQSMIGCIRLMNDLAEYSDNIYDHLKDRDVSKDFAKDQMEEEKEKAKKIIENSTWEDKIIEAEKWSFFKGAIRFLFRTGVNEYNWDIFDIRFKKTKLYFDENGTSLEYKKEAILLRTLISKFTAIDQFKGEIFDNNDASWKTILLNSQLIVALNQFFEIDNITGINFLEYSSTIIDEKLRDLQNDLCKSCILSYISPKSYFHWWNYDRYSIFPYNTKSQSKIYVLADNRNEILSKLEKDTVIKVDDWQRIEGVPYFKGWEIYFTLLSNDKKYQWWNCLKELIDNEWKAIPDVDLDNLKTYLKEIKT